MNKYDTTFFLLLIGVAQREVEKEAHWLLQLQRTLLTADVLLMIGHITTWRQHTNLLRGTTTTYNRVKLWLQYKPDIKACDSSQLQSQCSASQWRPWISLWAAGCVFAVCIFFADSWLDFCSTLAQLLCYHWVHSCRILINITPHRYHLKSRKDRTSRFKNSHLIKQCIKIMLMCICPLLWWSPAVSERLNRN